MKRLSKRLLIVVILVSAVMSAQARWGPADLVADIKRAESVQHAVDIAENALEWRGYEVVLTVNHAAAAESVGLELRPTQLIFARPPAYIENALLRRSQTAGIDLPVKILIFEEADGSIQSRGNPVGYMLDRHDMTVRDPLLRELDRGTAGLFESDDGLVTVTSRRSLEDTFFALQDAIDATGAFRVPLVLDYGERARRSNAILIVFGNPNAGTPLMQATQEIALDLPQKFLIWEDRNRNVNISYNDPFFIAKRHNVQGQDARLANISNALANLAAAGAGE